MKKLVFILPALVPTPLLAASGPFFSLNNTDFVVTVAFVLFVAVLLYLRVPAMVTKMLDERSKGIQLELDEARSLMEEAQSLFCLLYTSPSPRDLSTSRMPSSA